MKNDNSLRGISINRLLYDMVQETKISAGDGSLVMMIVDPYTIKILSAFLTISELFAKGIISIENLERKRKKFPKFHCIYFVNPTQENIDKIKEDYSDADRPQYARLHLFFCHPIKDNLLDDLICTSPLAKRIKICKELNISYFLRDRNLFDIGMPNALEIYTQISEKSKDISPQVENMLIEVAQRLFTVCVSMKEFPYVQFQKNSLLTIKLSKMINGLLKEFYKTKVFNEKRGILLILDRQIDATTPLLHDYSYESIIYDFFQISDNLLTFKEKKNKLDEKDEVWLKFKNKHIAEVLNGLQSDFREFMDSDASKKQRDKDNLESFEKMADLLHGMKEFKEKSRQFGLHLNVADEITKVRIFIINLEIW